MMCKFGWKLSHVIFSDGFDIQNGSNPRIWGRALQSLYWLWTSTHTMVHLTPIDSFTLKIKKSFYPYWKRHNVVVSWIWKSNLMIRLGWNMNHTSHNIHSVLLCRLWVFFVWLIFHVSAVVMLIGKDAAADENKCCLYYCVCSLHELVKYVWNGWWYIYIYIDIEKNST